MRKRIEVSTNREGNFGYSVTENAWLIQNYFDTSWLTPEMASDINRRLDNNCRPVVFMETNNYDTTIYSIISKKVSYLQRTQDAELYLKNTIIHDDKFTRQLIYISGKDQDVFYKEFNSKDISKILPQVKHAKGLTRLFWIDSDLHLWNFCHSGSFNIFMNSRAPMTRAPELNDAELTSASQATSTPAGTEKTEDISQPETPTATKKPQKGWAQIRAENKANPRKFDTNRPKRPRLIPSYERKFAYVLERYGQSYGALLLPMSEAETALYYARLAEMQANKERELAEQAELAQKFKDFKPKTPQTQKLSQNPPKKKLAEMTPEELKEHRREIDRRYRENRDKKEAEYLATLTPEQQEQYFAQKRAHLSEIQAKCYQRSKARLEEKKKTMTPEELQAFEAQEEIKKEEERRKNRERNARHRAKKKAEREQAKQTQREQNSQQVEQTQQTQSQSTEPQQTK